MPIDKRVLSLSLRSAAITALIVAGGIAAVSVVRLVSNGVFDGNWQANWTQTVELAAALGLAWFVAFFFYIYSSISADLPAEEILSQEPSPSSRHETPLTGFVAMEYYGLILNRTYLVFVGPEGLYGWKAEGVVSGEQPLYFQPYAEMLDDPEMMRDRDAIRKLSELKGGFFIPRSAIVSAEIVDKQKWGMNKIPHCGRIRIGLATGKSREFILLGNVYPKSIQESILAGTTGCPVIRF
jgi:hypothetical protein